MESYRSCASASVEHQHCDFGTTPRNSYVCLTEPKMEITIVRRSNTLLGLKKVSNS